MRPYQILRDIRHCLLGVFCYSSAITIAGGRLKVAKLDLSPGNPPQLVQLDALPQVVLQLLHRMLSHKACTSCPVRHQALCPPGHLPHWNPCLAGDCLMSQSLIPPLAILLSSFSCIPSSDGPPAPAQDVLAWKSFLAQAHLDGHLVQDKARD